MSKPKGGGDEELEEEVPEITDEDEETFAEFGITDAEQKAHAKILAAARVISHRRLNKKPVDPAPEGKPKWTPLRTPKGGK